MELSRHHFVETNIATPGGMRLLYWVLALLSFVPLGVVISMASTKISLAVIGAWTALIWIAISLVRGKFDYIVLAWVSVYPYCYYFLSFPKERSIFTVDRAFILLVVIEMLVLSKQGYTAPLTSDLRVAACLWSVYLFVSFVSLWGIPVGDVLGSYRLLLDGMLLPALFGLYAIRGFPIIRNLTRLHACVCILMIGIAIVTGVELFSSRNLLPWTGMEEEWLQTNDFKIIRVDGPFENSGILCLIGTMGFLFITYSRRLVGRYLTTRQRLLHWAGIWASLASAFMPMNRGLFVALLVCASLDYFAKNPLVSRSLWNRIFLLLLIAVVFARLVYPAVYEDRVSRPDNFYQRLAQDEQTLQVFRDHPLLGVGFNLYHDTVHGNSQYTARLKGFEAMDFPHNSLFAVLAEEGGIGLLLYVAAQVFFVRAMWRLRTVNRLGWQVFFYCFLVYTIYGLDVGMAYYSDLNLFYMFVLGLILQIQLHMVRKEPPTNDFSYR
jgi:hypothetical protein